MSKPFELNDVILKFREIHGDRYDYFNYKNMRTKMTVRCNECGIIFEQLPSNHIVGRGCINCRNIKYKEFFKCSQEEIIKRFIDVHGNRFDYSKVVYIGMHNKVIIICPIHGEFEQTPSNHLAGRGCQICRSSKGELLIRSILEKHNINFIQEYKIPGTNYRFEYDFYLPDHNLLIEFHGIQHFKPYGFFGNKKGLNIIKKRDMFKRELANLAKIPLLELNYKFLKIEQLEFEKILLNVLNIR